MHWLQSAALCRRFLCMANSREAVVTVVCSSAALRGDKMVETEWRPKKEHSSGRLFSTYWTQQQLPIFLFIDMLVWARLTNSGSRRENKGPNDKTPWCKQTLKIPSNSPLLTFCPWQKHKLRSVLRLHRSACKLLHFKHFDCWRKQLQWFTSLWKKVGFLSGTCNHTQSKGEPLPHPFEGSIQADQFGKFSKPVDFFFFFKS